MYVFERHDILVDLEHGPNCWIYYRLVVKYDNVGCSTTEARLVWCPKCLVDKRVSQLRIGIVYFPFFALVGIQEANLQIRLPDKTRSSFAGRDRRLVSVYSRTGLRLTK